MKTIFEVKKLATSMTIIGLTSLAGLATLASTATAQNSSIGINAAVKGNVTIDNAEQAAKQAMVKDPIFLGDHVNSQKLSSLQVLLRDETVFTVGPDCELTIDKFVYDPEGTNNSLQATVAKGMFRFMSGNTSKSNAENVSINTPVASMGVRGTMVEGLVGADAIALARTMGIIDENTKLDADGATLFVLRGPGKKHRSKNRKGEIRVRSGGQTITLTRSGMAVFVPHQDSPPFEPFLLSDIGFDVFNTRLRSIPSDAPTYQRFDVEPFLKIRERPEQIEREIFIPTRDLDWPEVEEEYEDYPEDPGPIPGNCTPSDPTYPNCLD